MVSRNQTFYIHRTSHQTKRLQQLLDERRDILVLDTRNDYEVRIGSFEGAIDLGISSFREFPAAINSLPDEYKSKQVVMYCTGGISVRRPLQ
ncbi:MAG: hypothetical protein Ct9H90mP24_5780 [Methanobacteriota archaeon]|nr:MAG: hypothetical protein Ct9H90mP24_5780 [Euryarchaeota archaeon]